MLCIMGIQSSTDIILWTVIHYTELLDSAFFKCINISDVNIEKIFEILGIQLSVDIILTVYSLYRACDTICFQIYKHFRHEY